MTEAKFCKLFNKFSDDDDDEFLKDERIKPERRLHRRPDINAFLLLDKLAGELHEGADRDIICSASHDEFSLHLDPKDVCKHATEEDIRDLIRCGVRIDGGFVMFA